MMKKHIRVLTIAGSDPSGGAGIQADIKTMSALGCFATSAITCVVNENTVGVFGIHEIPSDFVVGQIDSVLTDIGADAVKIGMLYSAELVGAVAKALLRHEALNIVVDPVMVATSGDTLMADGMVAALRTELFPLARLITPNIPEAETLVGFKIKNADDMRRAAREIGQSGASVLLKGGHMNDITDILYNVEDGTLSEFPTKKIDTKNTHGTGCTLSSAIASMLARGENLTNAVVKAKQYIAGAIEAGAEFEIGHGSGPMWHFYKFNF